MLSFRTQLLIALSLALIIVGGFGVHQIRSLQDQVHSVALQKDSIEAVADSTRKVLVADREIYTRRIVQTDLKVDSLDKALKSSSRVHASVTLHMAPVGGTTVAKAKVDSVTTLEFSTYSEPYHLDETISIGKDSVAHMLFSIAQDPIHINFRIECGEQVNGVRPASIYTVVPKYLTLSVDSVQQSMEVCSPASVRTNTGIRGLRTAGEVGMVVGGLLLINKYVIPLFVKR